MNEPTEKPPSGGALLSMMQNHRRGGVFTDASEAMRQVTEAVRLTGKAGKLTISFIIKPTSKGGALVVEDEIKTTASDKIDLPAEIKAGMAIYQGGPAYEVTARLKTRIEDRRLTLWFETVQKPQIVRENILLLIKEIATKTEIIPFQGSVND
jgi:hypothetical protein